MPSPYSRTLVHRPFTRPVIRPLDLALYLIFGGVCLATVGLPTPVMAQAQSMAHEFDIPAGPLAATLNRIGESTGLLLSFDPALVKGKTAPAVKGRLTTPHALGQALAGSGLSASADGVSIVIKTASPVPVSAQESVLPVVTVKAGATTATRSAAATKTDTALHHVAQSVRVVTEEQIEALGAQSVKDVLEHVSGVSAGQGEGRRDEFYLRGFYSPRDNTIDGVRDDTLYYRDLANIAQIEVVKGPAAALNGRGSAGGLINRVTKKPVAVPQLAMGAEVASHDQRRVTLDAGGALTEGVKSRFNFAYQGGGSYRDLIHGERIMVAPALSVALSPVTEVLLQAEWQNENRTPDRGQPSVNGKPAPVPARNFYGEAFDDTKTEQRNVKLRVDHAASDLLKISNTLQYANVDLDGLNTRNRSMVGTKVRRQIVYFPQQQKNLINQTEAVWTLKSGAVQHTLLTGLELAKQYRDTRVRASANGFLVDIDDPAHVLPAPDVASLPKTLDASFVAKTVGFYLQDQMTLSPHWKAQAGLRFDRFDQRQTDHLKGGAVLSRVDNTWSPRAGLVYQPAGNQSYYLTLSRSFQPIGTDLFSSEAGFESIQPLQTDLQEMGAKVDWLEGRLSTTAALYRLIQRNQLTADPADSTKKIQVGEQRSEGLEIDVSGWLTRTLNVMASYTYNNARITASNDSTIPVGNRPESTPRQSASLWLNQQLGQGWGVAAGAVYAADRFAMADNTVALPAYTRYDTMVYWRSPKLDVKIKVINLTNVRYAESANNNVQIGPGAPRSLTLSANYRF